MKEIKIEIDGVKAEIEIISRIILIREYNEGCSMSITYPESWNYTRAIQHATNLLDQIINRKLL